MIDALDRRMLLQNALLLAGAAYTPALSARTSLRGRASLPATTMKLLSAVADSMIPKTDTPGALEAGVPQMFAKLLANWASPVQRAGLLAALQEIDKDALAAAGASFAGLAPARRLELLNAYDKARAKDAGYLRLKDLLVTLYYLSEPGATVELRYEHSPGVWEPSIPLAAGVRNQDASSAF